MESWLVCYDISDPKRLRKVATACEDYGLRKQYSVFLCRISRTQFERLRARSFYGTPDVVAGKLQALAAEHGVEEIAVLTTLHDREARRRSYSLLANEMMS